MKRLQALIIACLLFTSAAEARSPRFRAFDSPNHVFAVGVERDILDPSLGGTWRNSTKPKLTRADIDRMLEWLEHAYDVQVTQLGFLPPHGERFRGRIKVKVEDFGEDEKKLGYVRFRRGILHLNARLAGALQDDSVGKHYWNRGQPIMQATIAHELFHAIQGAYDPKEDQWLIESTAQWAEDATFPNNNDLVGFETLFLRNPSAGLHMVRFAADADDPSETRLKTHLGRPYGSSIFFRFMSNQDDHPRKDVIVRDIWENSAKFQGSNSLAAVIDAVAGPDITSPTERTARFREYYDRFVIGCFLMESAPPKYRLADVDLFRHPKRESLNPPNPGELDHRIIRARWVDFEPRWETYLATGGTHPDDAILSFTFREMRKPNRRRDGQISGLGTRYFRVPKSDKMPAYGRVVASVRGSKDEISVQGVVREGQEWAVLPATYHDEEEVWQLQFPPHSQTDSGALIAVTRYSNQSTPEYAKAFPMTLSHMVPPHLVRLNIQQDLKTVTERTWSDVTDASGATTGRVVSVVDDTISAGAGPLEVALTFSQPVQAISGKPLATVNGKALPLQSTGDGNHWTGKLSPTALNPVGESTLTIHAATSGDWQLPLDEDPTSLPLLGYGGWLDYNATEEGLKIAIGRPAPFKPEILVRWPTRYPEGQESPLYGHVTLLLDKSPFPIDSEIYKPLHSKPEHVERGFYCWLLRWDYDGLSTYDYALFDPNRRLYDSGKEKLELRASIPVRKALPHPATVTVYTGDETHPTYELQTTLPARRASVQDWMSDSQVARYKAEIAAFNKSDEALLNQWKENSHNRTWQAWVKGYTDYISDHLSLYGQAWLTDNWELAVQELDRRIELGGGDWLRFEDSTALTHALRLKTDCYIAGMQYDQLDYWLRQMESYYQREMTSRQRISFGSLSLSWQELALVYAEELMDPERAQELLDRYLLLPKPVLSRVEKTQAAIDWAAKIRTFFPAEAFQ